MRRHSFSGFTLVELMIVVAVLAILVTLIYPSYQNQVRKGLRSAGQQFLMDIAQRQEQYLLDQRWYAADLATLNMQPPTEIAGKYDTSSNGLRFTVPAQAAGVTPTYTISLAPVSGGPLDGDGTLVINNLQQHWRETDGNLTYNTGGDCLWEDTGCTPH
ncbi:MAG TPA: type IV pilin protein [Burkholderiales bacterium]|nr:type IV pilin protein [Burkholderiales bacterium]